MPIEAEDNVERNFFKRARLKAVGWLVLIVVIAVVGKWVVYITPLVWVTR
jgi:hypothetical protein